MTSENPKNHVNAQRPSLDAHTETDKHPKKPTPPAPAESQSPPTPHKCEITCNTKRDWIDKTTLAFEGFGLLILITYTVATIVYACITHNMWKEIRTQTETGQKQLEQSERPWLKVDMAVTWFEFTAEGGARVTVQPHISNVGQSVATDVTFTAEMVVPEMDNQNRYFRVLKERQKEICDKMDAGVSPGPDMVRKVIFPKDSDASESGTLSVSKPDIGKSTRADGAIIPYVIGCVDYRFATALRGHRTPFIYMLGVQELKSPFRWIQPGEHLNARDVVVSKWPFGGFDAY